LNSGQPMTVRPLRRMSHAEETASIQAVLPDGWIAKRPNVCQCGRVYGRRKTWHIEDVFSYGLVYGQIMEAPRGDGYVGDVWAGEYGYRSTFATSVEAALWVVHRWRELNAREG
jgi:hypothetical protein